MITQEQIGKAYEMQVLADMFTRNYPARMVVDMLVRRQYDAGEHVGRVQGNQFTIHGYGVFEVRLVGNRWKVLPRG